MSYICPFVKSARAVTLLAAGALADRLATYVVGFGDHCAGAAPPELVFVSRDDSPVRVRVWTPRRHDIMRPVVVVCYKDRPRRIVLPAGVRAVDNGTDDKGNEITSFCHCPLADRPADSQRYDTIAERRPTSTFSGIA